MLELMGTPKAKMCWTRQSLYMRIYLLYRHMPASMLYNFSAACSVPRRHRQPCISCCRQKHRDLQPVFVIVLHMDVEGVAIAANLPIHFGGAHHPVLVRMEGCATWIFRLRFHISLNLNPAHRCAGGWPAELVQHFQCADPVFHQLLLVPRWRAVAAAASESFVCTSMNAIYQLPSTLPARTWGAKNYLVGIKC